MPTKRLSSTIGWVFVVCFFLDCLYLGFLNGQTALTDPDTCWLVAVGNFICQSGNIPRADPFSWILQIHPQPYIVYQWLSAAIFSCFYKVGGAAALSYLTASTIGAAFLIVPLLAAKIMRVSLPVVALAATLTLAAGSFHFPCRPEIFTYLMLAILNFAIVKISTSHSHLPLCLYGLVGLSFFALWANLHTGFVIGLIALSVIGFARRNARLLVALTGGLIGSLITPYGLALWQYLPHLFFSAANKYNVELLPLSPPELFSSDYWALDLIFVAVFIAWTAEIRAGFGLGRSAEKIAHFSLSNISWLLLSTTALLMSLQCRRLIPFAVLLLMGYLYEFLAQKKSDLPVYIQAWEKIAQLLLLRTRNLILFLPLALTCYGVSLSTGVFAPALPNNTPSSAIPVPEAALQIIAKNRPAGHMLNDPQFGDMLLLKSGKNAQVFIDTRFDVYSDPLVLDYWHMANCRGNWQALLKQYQIDWIFFPPQAPLGHRLAEDPNWQVIQSDNSSIIVVKKVLR